MKWLVAALGVALMATCGISIHLSMELQAHRQRIAMLEDQLASDPVASFRGLGGEAGLQDSSGASESASPPVEIELLEVTPRVPGPSPPRATVAFGPEAIARRREARRDGVRQSNPGFDEALGLEGNEVERLLDLLVAQNERSSAIIEGVRQSAASDSTSCPLSGLLEEHRRNSDVELQALLGDKYPLWQDYQQTRPMWHQRRDLNAVLEAAGVPLTESQNRSLIAALQVTWRQMAPERNPSGASVRHTPRIHQQLLDAAAPHLSLSQLDGYRQMLERAAEREEAMRALTGHGA